jgi:hypothetical protein
MPATKPDVLPPIDVGAWVRIGGKFQSATAPNKLSDWQMSDTYAELHAGGKIMKNVGVTVNLNVGGNAYGNGPGLVGLEDAILQLDFDDAFHVWAGRLLVQEDRANSGGPFFAIPWNFYSGLFNPIVAVPHEGPTGRSNGAVLWGDIQGGKFTYIGGVFDNGNVNTSPLYSARVRLALLDPEPGFWGNTSYFGDKDIFSIGLGGQYQSKGSTAGDKTWSEFNADVLFEKKTGPGGSYFSGEAEYYHFNDDDLAASDLFSVLAAFATSPVGVGNIQPHARFTYEKVKANPVSTPWNLDIGVAYLIKGPAFRVVATYSYSKLLLPGDATMTPAILPSNATSNAFFLSGQAIFF